MEAGRGPWESGHEELLVMGHRPSVWEMKMFSRQRVETDAQERVRENGYEGELDGPCAVPQ